MLCGISWFDWPTFAAAAIPFLAVAGNGDIQAGASGRAYRSCGVSGAEEGVTMSMLSRLGMSVENFLIDARYGWRTIRRAQAFSVVVIATIALAVGANTALFSVFNALVLTPLPVRNPSRLVGTDGNQLQHDRNPDDLRRDAAAVAKEPAALHGDDAVSGGGALRVAARGVETDGGVEGFDPEYSRWSVPAPRLAGYSSDLTPSGRAARP